MTKKSTSRTTKAVLASLLAVSIALPTAASANPISTSDHAASVIKEAVAAYQQVEFQIFKDGAAYSGMDRHLDKKGTITEKDGKKYANLTVTSDSAPMVTEVQTLQNGEYATADVTKNNDGTATYSFPVVEGQTYSAKLHVEAPEFNMDKWYEFDLKAEAAKKDPAAEVKTVSAKVYKDGTNEESMMKNYMADTATVEKTAAGNKVTLEFSFASLIKDFKVEGKEVKIASEDKSQDTRKYTFTVADLSKPVNAQLHVVVDQQGVKYDMNHKVQLGFDGVKPEINVIVNPFTDIDKDGNKEAILALYDKGIVKGGNGIDKFNPRSQITRSQFALMVARALDLKTDKDAGFEDLKGITDKERLSAINALAEAGIIQKNKKFNPNNTLTRQQGALMLTRAVEHATGSKVSQGDTSLKYYADGAVITDPEAKKAFAFLYDQKIMTGAKQPSGKVLISSGDALQRTQMAKILYGSLNIIK